MSPRRATAVVNAPGGGDAARIRKMMSSRPTLNANQRRAPKQDLLGATPTGTIIGRGGNTQQLGTAAMARMPSSPLPQAMPGAPAGGDSPDMVAPMAKNPGLSPEIYARGIGAPSGASGGAPTGGENDTTGMEELGAGAQDYMPGFGPGVQAPGAGLPPQIMQRLRALRGGGMQAGQGPGNPGAAPGGGFAGPGQQRSFQDFWQGGMTPRGM